METFEKKRIQIDEGLTVLPLVWYLIKIAKRIANTVFGFFAGAGATEITYGHLPAIGFVGIITTIILKDVLNDMTEWKAKYDLPDNTLSTKSTTVKDGTVTQSESIQKIDTPIVQKDET